LISSFWLSENEMPTAHELAILDRQIEMQKQALTQRLEEIAVVADIAESQALTATMRCPPGPDHVRPGCKSRPDRSGKSFSQNNFLRVLGPMHLPW
jgi:hypothetical protein